MEAANPINITRIDHVVLRVENMPVMLEFYCGVLGCRLERGPGELGLAQLRAGSSLIDLVAIDGRLGGSSRPPEREAQNVDHVCLLVRPWDEDTVLGHLRDHGVVPGDVASRYGATGQGPSIYLSDPEGNTVELKGDVG